MKKIIFLMAMLQASLLSAAGNDLVMMQRLPDDSSAINRIVTKPAGSSDGLLGFLGSTQRPSMIQLGQGLSLSGGVLSSAVAAGPAGPQGPKGDPSNVPGPAGADSQIPGPPGKDGVNGAPGAAGSAGANGISPVLSIGSVLSGTSSSATLTGSQSQPILNLVLQKGTDGAASTIPGPAGPAGKDSVVPGPAGANGKDGAPGATGPQGPIGLTGATGPAGTNGTNGTSAPIPTTAAATRALNTAFQPSTTRPVLVSYAVDVSVTSLLLAGTQGSVALQYADNSAMTTNLVTVDGGTNSTGGVLNVTNMGTVKLTALIPVGKYARITTTANTGAPVFTYRAGSETTF